MSTRASEPRPSERTTGPSLVEPAPTRLERWDLDAVGAERRDRIGRWLLAIADLISVIFAAFVAGEVAQSRDPSYGLALAVLPTLFIWLVLFKLYRLYERDAKRITHMTLDDLPWIAHAVLIGTLLFWGYSKVAPMTQLSFAETAVFATTTLLTMTVLRAGVRNSLPRVLGPERVLLTGNDSAVEPLIRRFEQNPNYGLVAVGRLSSPGDHDHPASMRRSGVGPPYLGGVEALANAATLTGASRLVISRPAFSDAQILEMIDVCRRLGVKVSILPDAVDALGPATEIDQVEGITILGLNPPVLSRTSRWLKRGFDLFVAGVLLLVLLPFLPLVALAIKLDSGGPIFFGQTRVGKAGRHFKVWKLRTMCSDAEDRRDALLSSSRDPHWLLLDHDPRITGVGRLLRRTSIDELPQLWNVIRGEMSLVGPRPLPEEEDAQIGGWERTRLDLTPGITGLWQVLGRTSIPFAEMVKLDYVYVTNWSLWLDFKLLLRTLPVVLGRRGAN
jgi:exopolysaccharide biosynthesis polyprenyl glycosylphosphotransferase